MDLPAVHLNGSPRPLRRLMRRGIGRRAAVVALRATVAALALGALAACGSEQPTATPPPGEPGAPAAAPMGFEAEWEALIEAAQDEGRLVMAGGGSSVFVRKYYEYFGDQFGIKTVLSGGSGTEQANRILAEQGAGRYEVDLVHAGNTTIKARLGPRALEFFPPWLFHPEVIDESLWFEGKHKYADPKTQTGFVYAARVSAPGTDGAGLSLWYNTNLVSQEEIEALETPWDLLQDKWKGEFVSGDVSGGGGGTGQLINAWRDPNMGEEWLRAYWLGMEPFITDDQRLIESSLVNGRFHWAYSSSADGLYDLRDLGAPVSNKFPRNLSFIRELTGGGTRGSFAIAKNPPHPSATKLYINWFLSREGQTYAQSRLERDIRPERGAMISLRDDDIPVGLTLPEFRREPGVTYQWEPDLNPELEDLRFELLAWLGELLGRTR